MDMIRLEEGFQNKCTCGAFFFFLEVAVSVLVVLHNDHSEDIPTCFGLACLCRLNAAIFRIVQRERDCVRFLIW